MFLLPVGTVVSMSIQNAYYLGCWFGVGHNREEKTSGEPRDRNERSEFAEFKHSTGR